MVLITSPHLFKRSLSVLLLSAMLFATTGCSESKRLSADAEAVAQETEDAKSRLETLGLDLEKANRSRRELQSQMNGQNDAEMIDQEIKSLRDKKQVMETEIGSLRKDFDAYRSRNA